MRIPARPASSSELRLCHEEELLTLLQSTAHMDVEKLKVSETGTKYLKQDEEHFIFRQFPLSLTVSTFIPTVGALL